MDSSRSERKASIVWRWISKRLAIDSVPAFPTTSQITFGGAPRRKLNRRKSSSLETRVSPSNAARAQISESDWPRRPRSRTRRLSGKEAATRCGSRGLIFSSKSRRVKARPHAAGGSASRRSRAAANANARRLSGERIDRQGVFAHLDLDRTGEMAVGSFGHLGAGDGVAHKSDSPLRRDPK